MSVSDANDTFPQKEVLSGDPPPSQVEELPMPKDVAVSDGNDVFPMSCKRFVATLRHSEHEVYTKLLLIEHGRENHTVGEWHAIIGDHAAHVAVNAAERLHLYFLRPNGFGGDPKSSVHGVRHGDSSRIIERDLHRRASRRIDENEIAGDL